jgi:hypothetical protein
MKRSTIRLVFMTVILAAGALWLPYAQAAQTCDFTGTRVFCDGDFRVSQVCIGGNLTEIRAECTTGPCCETGIPGILGCVVTIGQLTICFPVGF